MKKVGFVIGPQGGQWQGTYYDKFQKNKTLRPWLENVPSKYFIDEDGGSYDKKNDDAPFIRIDVAVGYGLKSVMDTLFAGHIKFDVITVPELSNKKLAQYDLIINQFLDGLIVPFIKRFEHKGVPHEGLMRLYEKHASRIYPPLEYHKLIMNKCAYYKYLESIGERVTPTLCIEKGQNVRAFLSERLVPFMKANKITQLFMKPVHGTDATGVYLFSDVRRKTFEDDFINQVQRVFSKKQFPGIVFQKYAKDFETRVPQARMYFIGNTYLYTVLTKWDQAYVYDKTIPSVKKEIPFEKLKKRATNIIGAIKKSYFDGAPTLLTRVDFGCCLDSKKTFFVNEIEFNGGNYVHMDPSPIEGRRFMYDKRIITQLVKVIQHRFDK